MPKDADAKRCQCQERPIPGEVNSKMQTLREAKANAEEPTMKEVNINGSGREAIATRG